MVHFSAIAWKKNQPWKNFLYLKKWNLLASYISNISGENFSSSSNKKLPPEQSSYVFSEKPFPVFQETELSITKNKEFQKRTFVAQKGKNHYEENVSYFEKRNFLALSLKKFLIFWEESLKSKAWKYFFFFFLNFKEFVKVN